MCALCACCVHVVCFLCASNPISVKRLRDLLIDHFQRLAACRNVGVRCLAMESIRSVIARCFENGALEAIALSMISSSASCSTGNQEPSEAWR